MYISLMYRLWKILLSNMSFGMALVYKHACAYTEWAKLKKPTLADIMRFLRKQC